MTEDVGAGESTASRRWHPPGMPESPAWALDWDALDQQIPLLRALADCPQDPLHHGEGDVLVHTRLVVEALVASPVWRGLPTDERSSLLMAALLHDAGKPAKTVRDPDGRISSPGHSAAGARLARSLLYRGAGGLSAPPLIRREAIVGLVRHHGLPLRVWEEADPTRAAIAASLRTRLDHLALLAEADVRGRHSPDQANLLDLVALFRALAAEAGCLDRPRSFSSDRVRYRYLSGGGVSPDGELFDGSWGEVTILCGLPGAGKTTWLRAEEPGRPVVALDVLRTSLKVSPAADQGPVVARAKELARDLLRRRQAFAWDATNVTRAIRDPLVALAIGYGARVRLVYVETPYDELIRRNRTRSSPVPTGVIERLVDRLDVPDLSEAHRVTWVSGSADPPHPPD
jgi:predicted kinase